MRTLAIVGLLGALMGGQTAFERFGSSPYTPPKDPCPPEPQKYQQERIAEAQAKRARKAAKKARP